MKSAINGVRRGGIAVNFGLIAANRLNDSGVSLLVCKYSIVHHCTGIHVGIIILIADVSTGMFLVVENMPRGR